MTSTFYNPTLVRTAFMDVHTIEDNDDFLNVKTTYQLLDLQSEEIYRILRNLTRYTVYRWKSTDKLSNLSYNYYETTSLWWIIAAFNGIVHELELEDGTEILIPDHLQIIETVQKAQQKQPPDFAVI